MFLIYDIGKTLTITMPQYGEETGSLVRLTLVEEG